MYYKIEKNKLKATTMKKKYKFTEASLQKMLLHIALNFEIKKSNEDIKHQLTTNSSKNSLKGSPSLKEVQPVEEIPEETKNEEQPPIENE